MAITLTQLSAFLAVARAGSVTAAADELFVTQPSVSSALSALSHELGCELFERSGRSIRLTDAGRAFVPYAGDVLGLLGQGKLAAREAAAVTERQLRIAAVTTAAESFVPPLMQRFSEHHPDLQLTLEVGNRKTVLERVLEHAVDVAISGQPPHDERLAASALLDNEIVCITSPSDGAVRRGPLSTSDIEGYRWLLREAGSGTRLLNETFLADSGLAPHTLTLGSNGAIKQAARAGLGISLVSRAAVEPELSSGQLGELRLIDGPASRKWFVLHSITGPMRPVAEAFLNFLRESVAGPASGAARAGSASAGRPRRH